MFPKYVVVLVALSLGQSLVMVSTPLLLGKITSGIKSVGEAASTPHANSTGLIWFYVLWLLCAFCSIGLTIGLRYSQIALDLRMVNAIRERLFSSIIHQRPAFFHANDPGRLTMLVNQMSIDAQMAFRQVVLDPFFQVFSFLLGVSGLLYSFGQLQQGDGSHILWIGVAVVLVLALLSPLAVGKLGNRLQASSKDVVEQNLAIASLVTSSLKSPEEVQAFNAEDYFIRKYQAVLEKVRLSRICQTMTVEAVNTFNSLPTVLIQVLFIGVAVAMVVAHPTPAAQAGYLISVLLLVPQIMGPIQAISSYMVLLRSSWPSVETVLQNLPDGEFGFKSASASTHQKPEPTLESKNLVFRYRPDLPPVFNDVSFTVPAGKITGLVAKMGQGKTTFFRLALGFYQPESGQILLGGNPASDYPLAELRQHAVMMAQFPAFFHDTLRDNLRLAKPDASDQELRWLCEKTGVWPILVEKVGNDEAKKRFPNPLDRNFGGGEVLSGGQKKLLALTRCLLRSPSFLFLDEPTVGMDNIEKFDLVQGLRNACQGKTVMVVDHDIPWLIHFCDYFLVLDAGKLVQQGTAEMLLASDGLFKELYGIARPCNGSKISFQLGKNALCQAAILYHGDKEEYSG
ncbi:MAG: ABC transporter ATP-binding protein [Verrucomicrobiota bacterium]